MQKTEKGLRPHSIGEIEIEYQPYFIEYLRCNKNAKVPGDESFRGWEYVHWIQAKHLKFKKLNNIDTYSFYSDKQREVFYKWLKEE